MLTRSNPGIAVMGTVVLKDTSDGIMMTGTLGGLETSTMGGIHIHTGVSCDDANNVGGHYYPGMASDPWTSTMWYSDSMGSSNVKFTVPMFSLTGMNPVANRAVVVHDSSGNRIACGVLMSTVGEVVAHFASFYGRVDGFADGVARFILANSSSQRCITPYCRIMLSQHCTGCISSVPPATTAAHN